MPRELKITEKNLEGFKTIYDDFQINPSYYQRHERSTEFLKVVELYQERLDAERISKIPFRPDKTDLPADATFTPTEDYIPTLREPIESKNIVEPQESGFSEPMVVGDRKGRFNWDVPPEYSEGIGGGEVPMYRFETEDGGAWNYRIDERGQGGRFEDAWHFPQDFKEMNANPEIIDGWWGEKSEITNFLKQAVSTGMSLEETKAGMKQFNTYRQISGDTPPSQFNTIANMKPVQAGEIIDESDGFAAVKERKMQALIDVRNSWIHGSYQLVDIAGGALIWSGLNEELGIRIRKFGKEVLKDYQVDFLTKEFEIEDLKKAEFYYTKGVQMIPMLLTLIPTAIAAGSGGGAAAAALGLGKLGIGITAAVTSALASRPLESIMEAIGTYNEMIDSGESKEKAGEAAADVFQKNMSLIGMDAGQYALAFAKVPAAFRKPMSNWIVNAGVKAVGFAAGAVSEGYEEVIQNYFQELGKASARGETPPDLLKALALATPEQKEAFALGTLAGTGFQAVRTIQESRIKDEVITPEEADQIVKEVIAIAEEKAEEAKIEETKKAEPVAEPITEPVIEKTIEEEPEKKEVKPKVEKPIEEEIIEPVQPVEGRKAAEPKIEKPKKPIEGKVTTKPTEEERITEITAKVKKERPDISDEAAEKIATETVQGELKTLKPTEKAEKPKEAPIIPKKEEPPAERKPGGKKTILAPLTKYQVETARRTVSFEYRMDEDKPSLKKRYEEFKKAKTHEEAEKLLLEKYPKLIPKITEFDIPKLVAGMGPPGQVVSRLEEKKFFTDIYTNIEKQINKGLDALNKKDVFYEHKQSFFQDMKGMQLKPGENFTIDKKVITITTDRGRYQFAVPKSIAELLDLKKSVNLAFKPPEKIPVGGPRKRGPIMKAIKTLHEGTADPKEIAKAEKLLSQEGIGYTKPVKIDMMGSKSKKIQEQEERLANMAISGGMEGTTPTPVQDHSGEFEMTELTKWEKFRAFWEDSNTRLHTLNNNIEVIAGGDIKENLDLYMQKDMLSRLESDKVRRIRNEKRAYAIDFTEKGLDVDEVGELAVAEHAFERNRVMNKGRVEIGKEPIEGLSGMTDEQAQPIIDKATPEMKAETEKLREMFDDLLTESVELGLTTEKIATAYRNTYDYYVALFRDMESDNISGIGTGQGIDIRGQESKRAKGSLRTVHNPIANYFFSKERLMIRKLKNDIGVSIAQMVDEYPFLEALFEIRKTPMRPAGKVTHKAAYDVEFQDNLLDFAFKIGLKDFATKGQVGRVLGYYVRGVKKIVKKLGAGERVLAHESGHFISDILSAKYDFKKEFYRNIKKSKAIGQEIHDHSVRQGEKGTRLGKVEEKWANAFSWWMMHRGQAKEDMPLFDKRIREIINEHPELKPLLDIRPSPTFGLEEITQDIFVEYFPTGPNEIGFKSEGKQYFIKIKDDALAVALKDINLARIGKGVRTMRIALAVWSSFKTKYRPEFLLTNFERDLGEALVNLGIERHLLGKKGKGLRRAVVKDLFSSQRGIYKYMREAHDKAEAPEGHEAVDEFFRLGGDVGKYWLQDIGKTEKTLRQIQDEITGEGINKLMNPIRQAEQLIDALQSAVELGIRFSTYKQLVNRGMSKPKAIQAVADLTVNFSRQGNIGPVLKSLYGFIGPAIQGTSKIARVLATPYGRKYKSKVFAAKIGGAAASLAVLGFGVRMLSNLMDPDGDEQMNDYTKNHRIAFSFNGKTYSFWNMPYGYTSFYSIGNNMAEVALGRKTMKEALLGVFDTSVNSFSPWGTSLYDFVPTLAKPIFEINSNEGWYGSDIYPEQVFTLTPAPDHETYFKNARKSAIFATKLLYHTTGIDIHPNSLQYGFSQWGGGPFEFVLDTYESSARGLKGEFNPNKTPFVRQFFRIGSPDSWSYGTIYKTLEESFKRQMSPMEKDRFYRAVNVGLEEEIFGDTEKVRILKANSFIQKFIKAQYKMAGGIFLPENLIKLDQMPQNDKNRLIATYGLATRKRLQKVVIFYK